MDDYIACPTCTYHNPLENITCIICDSDLNGTSIGSRDSSSNSLDNNVNESEGWSCPTCTYNNHIDADVCVMCNHGNRPSNMRRPDDIINDRLINDDDDDELCMRSTESNSIHPLTASALGAIGGIMLARFQNRPMSTGALQGAAYGAMGGMLLNELSANTSIENEMRTNQRNSSEREDEIFERHNRFFRSFRENNRSLFQVFSEFLETDNDQNPSSERLHTINSLPTHTYNSDSAGHDDSQSSCNICLESFSKGDDVKTLPCLHMFHSQCIDTWLSRKAECPCCKFSLN